MPPLKAEKFAFSWLILLILFSVIATAAQLFKLGFADLRLFASLLLASWVSCNRVCRIDN
jgi:hypothetical protein